MSILGYLQKVGRALMVPVATLPAAAILMGVGYWIDPVGWGGDSALAAFFIKSGSAIIDNMGVLFAVGVAYGMSKDKDGSAALAGFVGFLVLTTLCSPAAVAMIQKIPADQVPAAFGKIENQFVGILVGIISAELYNRFSSVELPKALSFFSGRRLVPILTSFVMIAVAFVLMYVWPVVFSGLVNFGEHIQKLGSVGAGVYAFFNRLLIPVGLHHALNSVFWFDVAGINDIPNFLGGAQSIEAGKAVVGITGRYQAGFFPIMMFGLPGAALAIYHCARPENKAKVLGIMMAGAFAAFFTGITEPLEFSFMFVAPVLYVIHAILTGISVYIAASMQWIAGFGFSAGLVDMFFSARNPLATHWYMLIPQGLVFFAIYYVVFRFTITKFNLLTPGRELAVAGDETDGQDVNVSGDQAQDTSQLARQYIAAVGGSANLTGIDACITRLRLTVKDSALVNESLAKRLGATGVIRLNKTSVQIIVGFVAEKIANAMKTSGDVPAAEAAPVSVAKPTLAAVKPQADAGARVIAALVSPVTGDIVALEQVPDEAFASKAVGDGVAVKPTESLVVSPAAGTIVKIFNTNHAFCLETEKGAEIVVHMGIDTVALNGQGFTRLVEEGAEVVAGQPVLEMDLDFLNANARSMVSPVVCSNIDDFSGLTIQAQGSVIAGQTPLYTISGK
ncbi:PTS system N-acetylglucosamine-specific IIA component (Glc family) /PTS system N-acetylglucosamine-specific IIB component (Glc family) /PTS system N-acetylglucosamine-specific IIC component (Glc family) [Enterobacter sp. BIGb0383]|uniref:N-acetylglucosamine-specific PTS transporter subunit IIBC n=1 Tax=unclassified Enterobacter TaxID=2608935 RepID=UPI000F49DAB0|nr:MULTISPECIES: N-acetylglucosamine-specific PTS transporter subunit IIBC [unclassified Enterobacter]ROP59219.1 PTS system N-acetylglucosamine-specific IIA component (Glc family) /PTS system N-acetylglucosamine-specific IIB component (Glc family) /PTS system N-acetylglucosamine-specific IIC component (Glc family) [Enterobacter sp. BIGb0383]ROS09315.1 PTS system N-acetylglucosamine-specific IIA component (Glc family) /PTS system N-acetylglucosamine-specific IIB component (Glc family) /PTS system 